jgi:hypothetical protein
MPKLLVFGARGLGRAIAEHLMPQGWEAVGVARSQDLTDPARMREVVANAAPFDLAVNAMSPKGRFGGGDLTTTDDDAMAPYLQQLLPEVFAFYRLCGAALVENGGGTLVQVTGGSARRALPGRAPWAVLLVCDGSFGTPGDDAGGERIDPVDLAKAIQYLHEQGRSAWTHELVVTPVGDRWTP